MIQARAVCVNRIAAILAAALLLCAAVAWAPSKAAAFDVDGALQACEEYPLPEQVDQRLACVNNCIDSLSSFLKSLKGTYGPGTTACGVQCVSTFKTKINACVDKIRSGVSEAKVEACIDRTAAEAEACAGGCGYPDDDL